VAEPNVPADPEPHTPTPTPTSATTPDEASSGFDPDAPRGKLPSWKRLFGRGRFKRRAKGAGHGPKQAKGVKPRKRFRPFLWMFRLGVYGISAVAILLVIGYLVAGQLLKPADLLVSIKQLVEEQTGGRFDIGNVKFDLLSGISLESVQFYPPAAGDTRGFRAGGEVMPVPLANFDALVIGYSIPKMLAGRIHITALQLVEPQVHLRQTDGVFNFQSILDFRAKAFPPVPEEPAKPEEPQPEKKPGTPPEFLLSPTLAYMPVEILTRDIGIKNLRFDLIKEEKGQVSQIIMSNGLSIDLGMHWFGTDSSMWLSVLSPMETPLEVSIQDAQMDEAGNLLPDLQQTLSVKTALSMRGELRDLKRINYDLAMRIASVQTPLASYEDVGVFARVRLEADDAYKTVKIGEISADLADVVTYGLAGKVSLSSFAAESIYLKLTQSFELDLDAAARLAKPFVPQLEMGGLINADAFEIEGTLEPEKLAKAAENPAGGFPVPDVWGIVWLEEVWARYPGTGVEMEPISGDVQLMVGPAMNGDGTQLDLDVEMQIPEVSVTQTVPKVGKVTAGVGDMQVKMTTRALYPALMAPIFKLDVEAQHVRASGDHIAALDVPLLIDVDADGRADMQRMGFSATMELTDLVDFSAMAECQNRCSRFRSSVQTRLDSFTKLHAIALPLGAALGLTDFMPTKLDGAADFQFQARGRLPDPLTTPPLDIPRLADVRWNLSASVDKLDAKVPFFDVDLRGFGTRVLAGGSMKDQRIELSEKFDKVSVTLPMMKKPDGKPQTAEVSRFNFETVVQNDIDGELDLTNIPALLQKLATEVRTKLAIGKVAGLEGLLPKPVSDFQLNLEVAQQKLADIQLRGLSVRVPDFGVAVDAKAEARVGADFMPQRLKLDFKTDVAMTGAEPIPMGLKTSGGMNVRLGVEADDIKLAVAPGATPLDMVQNLVVKVDGGTSFEKFNLHVPDFKDAAKPPLLVVEDIRGEIPFKQTVDVRAMLLMLEKLKKKAPVPVDGKAAEALAAADAEGDAVAAASGAAKDQAQLNTAMKKYFDKHEDKLMKNANVAAIMDYGTVRPFYPERRPLSIKRIEAANLELSRLEFDLELRQNWFAINQYVINFLGGKIHGDLQLAFDPIPRFVRTTVHMTKLDTRKLLDRFPNLKGKTTSTLDFLGSDPEIDGTVRFSYDVGASDMNGGVEITKIGKEQVEMMLYFIDPYEQNPSIADLRKALMLGEPSHVSIPIKSSRVGFEIEITSLITLGQPIPGLPKFRDIPINQIVDGVIEKVLAEAQKPQAEGAEGEGEAPADGATPPASVSEPGPAASAKTDPPPKSAAKTTPPAENTPASATAPAAKNPKKG
jgi:hypothetical protein